MNTAAPPPTVPLRLDPEAFRFHSFREWVNKAPSRYDHHGLSSRNTLAVDTLGRICRNGFDFQAAEREGAFPVVVYRYREG